MKFLKIAGITIVSFMVLLYLTFLFVIPNVVNLNSFKPDIQKIAKDEADLNIDFDNAKITVTPLLSIGIKADNLSVKLPDNSEIFKTDAFIGRISLPHLLFLTAKVSKAEVINPQINIDIVDGKEYKIVRYLEDLSKKEIKKEQEQTAQKPCQNQVNFKIDIPEIKISNYALLVNDLKTKDYLKLRGDELLLSYKDNKNLAIKTAAEFFVNENKNITADIDIDTFIPSYSTENADKSLNETTKEKAQFINPVAIYKTYNLKTNISSKLKIREKNNQIISKGHLDIENLTLMLSGISLPESRLHIETNDTNLKADCDLNITNIEKLSLKASGDYGKNTSLDMTLKSNEIHIANLLKLLEAGLNSANIKNELSSFQGNGYFIADTSFNTNFKELKSNGNITFKDVDIKDLKKNKRIARINSIISLDNSILKFVDTTLEVFETLFTIDGTINQKSIADIKIVMQKLPLEQVFTMFLPREINEAYKVNSGFVNLSADLTGELKELKGKVKAVLSNVSLKDTVNGINYLNNLLTADFESDFKTFKGTINNSDFKLTMNGANINCEKFSLNVGDKDIVINPALIKINNSTNIDIAGTVKDYINNPAFDIDAKGALKTADLKQLLGRDIAVYIKEKGTLPILAKVTGDNKKQTVEISVSADANNYITPVNIASIFNKNTVINTVIDIKDNKLTLKDTGLFIKNENTKKEIIGLDGTISKLDTKNPIINMLKVRIPNDISGSLVVFPQSKFNAKGDIVISGDINNPKIRGDFSAWDISIPEIYTTIEKAVAKFEDKNLDIELKKLLANGSDFNIVINADLSPSNNFVIKTLNLISGFMDADKVMKVSELLAKYTTPESSLNSQSSRMPQSASSTPDIAVVIKDGSIDIKELKSGAITLTETSGKISMAKNIFYINNLITSGFKGKIKGDVSTNLITSEIKADVKGTGMDVEQTLLETANMKDTLTGTMDFDANVSLKGSAYEEQVKTLKGIVNFTMKDGSLGALGRIENLVSADNLSSSSSLRTLINTTLKSTVDTSKYNILKGHLSFDNGIAQINPITSSGDYMSTYIFGKFDVLKNQADMKLRGRLGSKVTESMGQLAMLNPVYVVKNTSGMNMLLGNLLLTMCEKVTDDEMAQIPTIAKENSDENTAKFQVVLRGDAAKPQKLVRSFKWLATEKQIKEAKDYLGTLSVISVPADVKELKQQAKDILKNLTSEGTNQTTQHGKDAVDAVKSLLNNATVTDSNGNTTSLKNAFKQFAQQAKTQVETQTTEETGASD